MYDFPIEIIPAAVCLVAAFMATCIVPAVDSITGVKIAWWNWPFAICGFVIFVTAGVGMVYIFGGSLYALVKYLWGIN